MTAWSYMTAEAKNAVVLREIEAGKTYAAIAERYGVTRGQVAGVVSRLRASGALKRPLDPVKAAAGRGESTPGSRRSAKAKLGAKSADGTEPPVEAPRSAGKPGSNRTKAVRAARAARAAKPHPGNIANKAESRKGDPGLPITVTSAAAWDPLPGIEPISLLDLTEHTCKWAVDGLEGSARLFCGAPSEAKCSWCSTHRKLAFVLSCREIS